MEEKKKFIIDFVYICLILLLVFLGFKYIMPALVPFIVGFILAYGAVFVSRKLFKSNSKLIRTLSLIGIYILLVVLAVILISTIVSKTIEAVQAAPAIFTSYVEPAINTIRDELIRLNSNMPVQVKTILQGNIEDVITGIKNLVYTISGWLIAFTTSLITSTPQMFVSVVLTVVSSFFMVLDYEVVVKFIGSLMSEKIRSIVKDVEYFISHKLFNILKSYAVIMFITGMELFVGFLIMRLPNAGIYAALVAILDILPVLGVGTVLIPWAIIAFIRGDIINGIIVVILYLIISVIRNIIEPRFVGGDLGLHPLATLVSMIVGLNLFGVLGMFGIPLTLSFIINRKKAQE